MKFGKGKSKDNLKKAEEQDINTLKEELPETVEKQQEQVEGKKQEKPEKDQAIENLKKLEKMKHGRNRARVITLLAIFVAAAAILFAVGIYQTNYNKVITVISTVGDITFTDKVRDDKGCYVTFRAPEYNRIPSQWQDSGVRVQIDSAFYDILVLDTEYDSANIVFEVPQGIARKAGYSQEKMNIQSLWTEEILTEYTSVRNIIWSMDYH